MEYKEIWYSIFGILGLLFWSFKLFRIFQHPQLVFPKALGNKKFNANRYITFILGIIGWLFISYALMGPRKPLKNLPGDIEVNDVFLVVDVSRSMLAEDLRPNRLEVAKEKLREFAALRPTDRLGVIIFSEQVFTLLPLTTDPTLVDKILGEIRIGFLGSGTNIGDALGLAVARAQKSNTKNKVIILLTDGVNNVGNMTPLNAARTAKDFNIKVYTIGLGRTKSKLPIGRDARGKARYQNIPGGSIDIETLEEISKLTGGKSYMAGSEDSLQEILSEIQELEKTKIQSEGIVVYDEQFKQYLIWGLFFLICSEFYRRLILREVL